MLKIYIASTHYYDAKKIVDSIKEGNYLIFQREVKNPYDNMAAAIMDLDKNKPQILWMPVKLSLGSFIRKNGPGII